MDAATLFSSQQDLLVKVRDPRRGVRRVVHIPAAVSDKRGRVNCVVTNLSEAGCELRLVTSYFLSQYLTLKLYPHDGAAAVQITLAKIRWVQREWVGVEFVSWSQKDQAKFQQLWSELVVLASGDSMHTMLAPGVYIEEVDPGVPVMSALTRVTARRAIEQGCRQELRWLAFEENVPRTWSHAVQSIREFLFVLWAREALKGVRAEEAFFVKCDLTTMTPEDLREGMLSCLVGVAPIKPAEFILYRIHIRLKPPIVIPSAAGEKPAAMRPMRRLVAVLLMLGLAGPAVAGELPALWPVSSTAAPTTSCTIPALNAFA